MATPDDDHPLLASSDSSSYNRALELKSSASKSSKDLVNLDKWYRETLVQTLRERLANPQGDSSSAGGCWLTRDELGRLVKWKLARGKYRPRLESLALSNEVDQVQSTTRAAYTTLYPPGLTSSSRGKHTQGRTTDVDNNRARQALDRLSRLKGVGPATASAVLALFSLVHSSSSSCSTSPCKGIDDKDTEKDDDYVEDDQDPGEPFMSDELVEAMFGSSYKIEYTVKGWTQLRTAARERVQRGGESDAKGKVWNNVHELEKAAWAWSVLNKFGDDAADKGTPESSLTKPNKRSTTGSGGATEPISKRPRTMTK